MLLLRLYSLIRQFFCVLKIKEKVIRETEKVS